jgi:hypothetical protein
MEWIKASIVRMDLSSMAQFSFIFKKKIGKFFVLPTLPLLAFRSKNPHNFLSQILLYEKITLPW